MQFTCALVRVRDNRRIKFANVVGGSSHKEHNHIRTFGKADESYVKPQSRCPLSELIFEPVTFTTRSKQDHQIFCALMAIFSEQAALALQSWIFMVTTSYFTNSYRQNHHPSMPARCSHLSPRMFVQLAYLNSTALGWVFLFCSLLCKP
jgi:hypothetical protein